MRKAKNTLFSLFLTAIIMAFSGSVFASEPETLTRARTDTSIEAGSKTLGLSGEIDGTTKSNAYTTVDNGFFTIDLPKDWMTWTSTEATFAAESPDKGRLGVFFAMMVPTNLGPEEYIRIQMNSIAADFGEKEAGEPEKIVFSTGSHMQRFVVGYTRTIQMPNSRPFNIVEFAEAYPGGGLIHYYYSCDGSVEPDNHSRSELIKWIDSVRMG